MSDSSPGHIVTELLDRARNGDENAFSQLVAEIYQELRNIARNQRRRLSASDTMNTTAIVHEAYAKMAGSAKQANGVAIVDRGHFFRVASRVMRDVIVDYARAQSAKKRGGPNRAISLDKIGTIARGENQVDLAEVLTIHQALTSLEQVDPDAAQVAELRYFAGLTMEQTAETIQVSESTVKRRWAAAKLWLYRHLEDSRPQA